MGSPTEETARHPEMPSPIRINDVEGFDCSATNENSSMSSEWNEQLHNGVVTGGVRLGVENGEWINEALRF